MANILKNNPGFKLKHSNSYCYSPAQFKKPHELGNFCYNKKREFVHGDSELRYYHEADLKHPSLAQGFETYIDRDTSIQENLNGLLNYFMYSNHPQLEGSGSKFVLYRGIMTKIFCSPYQNRDSWRLAITKFKGVTYINEIKKEEQQYQNEAEAEKHKKFCYYGYKFETLSTLPNPAKENDEGLTQMLEDRLIEVVDNHVELASVFKTKLGQHDLIMGAEVDCVMDDSSDRKYIELKTSRIIENEKQQNSFKRYKLLKFWAQSFLAGIPKVVVGFRDDMGDLKLIQHYDTLEIPRLVKGIRGIWEPSVCINFANELLDFVSKQHIEDNPNSCTILAYNPDTRLITLKTDPSPSSYTFLHQAFIDSVSKV